MKDKNEGCPRGTHPGYIEFWASCVSMSPLEIPLILRCFQHNVTTYKGSVTSSSSPQHTGRAGMTAGNPRYGLARILEQMIAHLSGPELDNHVLVACT